MPGLRLASSVADRLGWARFHLGYGRAQGGGRVLPAELLTVPERGFAVVALSNAGPDDGVAFNQAVVRRALQTYLGVIDRDPEPLRMTGRGPRRSSGATRTRS